LGKPGIFAFLSQRDCYLKKGVIYWIYYGDEKLA